VGVLAAAPLLPRVGFGVIALAGEAATTAFLGVRVAFGAGFLPRVALGLGEGDGATTSLTTSTAAAFAPLLPRVGFGVIALAGDAFLGVRDAFGAGFLPRVALGLGEGDGATTSLTTSSAACTAAFARPPRLGLGVSLGVTGFGPERPIRLTGLAFLAAPRRPPLLTGGDETLVASTTAMATGSATTTLDFFPPRLTGVGGLIGLERLDVGDMATTATDAAILPSLGLAGAGSAAAAFRPLPRLAGVGDLVLAGLFAAARPRLVTALTTGDARGVTTTSTGFPRFPLGDLATGTGTSAMGEGTLTDDAFAGVLPLRGVLPLAGVLPLGDFAMGAGVSAMGEGILTGEAFAGVLLLRGVLPLAGVLPFGGLLTLGDLAGEANTRCRPVGLKVSGKPFLPRGEAIRRLTPDNREALGLLLPLNRSRTPTKLVLLRPEEKKKFKE
jgi:hypothetical protein